MNRHLRLVLLRAIELGFSGPAVGSVVRRKLGARCGSGSIGRRSLTCGSARSIRRGGRTAIDRRAHAVRHCDITERHIAWLRLPARRGFAPFLRSDERRTNLRRRRIKRRLAGPEQVFLDLAAALVGFDALGRTHDGAEDDLRPSPVTEAVDAERLAAGELAPLPLQPLLDGAGAKHGIVDALEDALLLEAREQVGEQVPLVLQLDPRIRIHLRRRVEGHGNVVVAVIVEHDMAEEFEVLADLLVAMDVVESRQDLDHRALFGLAHLGQQPIEAVHRPAHGHEQQADIDENGDGERHVIALRQPGAFCCEWPRRSSSSLDRLHGPLLQVSQLVGGGRQLER